MLRARQGLPEFPRRAVQLHGRRGESQSDIGLPEGVQQLGPDERRAGKLPFQTHSYSYDLEYGSDTLEMHTDALSSGQRVLVVDDLLATGGTVEACVKLLSNFSVTIVECAFCIHLKALCGEARLKPHKTFSLIEY